MGLGEIADGLEVTATQEERGVAVVDETDATVAERLRPFAEALPCPPATAATVLERYAVGAGVGAAGRAAGVAPVTAAKTLHMIGEPVSPVGPTGREVVRDWIDGRLSRTEALELAGVTETEFALAAYIETHEPIEAAQRAVEGLLTAQRVGLREP